MQGQAATLQRLSSDKTARLPKLRSTLQVIEGPEDRSGHPTLQIFDPVRNAHFRFVYPNSLILKHWATGGGKNLTQLVAKANGLVVKAADIKILAAFLAENELFEDDGQSNENAPWQGLVQRQIEQRKPSWPAQLAHHYLFLRVPLLNPDKALSRLAERMAFLISMPSLVAFAALSIITLFLVSRQTDAIIADLKSAISMANVPLFAVALLALKAVHEFGHAIVAKIHGTRVPAMGIAMMLGIPVFYTDTTDVWRLKERGKRLSVVVAGVGAELLVAVPLLLLWTLLPEGTLRTIAAVLATLTVVTSLIINLNPFMRYDGYFALSDMTGIANLQDRSFQHTRSHLRALLFGLPMAADSQLSLAQQRFIVIYGYATIIYRTMLYIAIALLVYTLTFKALGLALLAFELYWFILRPIARELKVWWLLRERIKASGRTRWTAGALAVTLLFLVLPLDRIVEAPALRQASLETEVYAPQSARFAEIMVADGMAVTEGQLLYRLENPDLAASRAQVEAELKSVRLRQARAPVFEEDRRKLPLLLNEEAALIAKHDGIVALERGLEVRAPIAGIIVDQQPWIADGVWANQEQLLARIIQTHEFQVRTLLQEGDVGRLGKDAMGVFISETGSADPVDVSVEAIAGGPTQHLNDEQLLADINGGPIKTSSVDPAHLRPAKSTFAVLLVGQGMAPLFVERGVVRITAKPQSPAARFLRHAAQVITRESGF